jgi:hypothetical protein
MLWFAVAVLPVLLGFAVAGSRARAIVGVVCVILWTIFVSAPATAGVFHMAATMAKRDLPSVSDILVGARQFGAASWKLAAAQMAISIVALSDIVFFYVQFAHTHNFFFALAGALAVYGLGFWGMMVVLQWPLLVEQRPTTLKLIYRSLLFVADNLSFTTIIFFVIILLTILCIGPGVALLLMGAIAVTTTTALRELFRKYGLVEIESEVVEDRGWHIGDYR